MTRADIAWSRTDAEGASLEVYAHQVGSRWVFYSRPGRDAEWKPLGEPPLEDWLEVLDAVRRRTQRRRYGPEVASKLEAELRRRFPRAKF